MSRGGRVIATARNIQDLSYLDGVANDRVIKVKLDVTKSSDIEIAIKAAHDFGGVDVLVNNAGYGFIGGIEESSDAEVRAMFEVNFFGAVALTRAVLPSMRKNKSGFIVNISSIAGISSGPGGGYYSATKFALEGMTEALALEGKELGIQALIVEHGVFRTSFFGRSLTLPKTRIPDYTLVGKTQSYAQNADGVQPGDPDRAANIIIDTVEQENPPMRLLVGHGVCENAEDVLQARIDECRSQGEVAQSACFD